jgi:hypothetical protein
MQPQPQAKVARVPRARGDECMAQGDGQRVCGPRVKRTGVQPQANAARVWQAMGDGYPVSWWKALARRTLRKVWGRGKNEPTENTAGQPQDVSYMWKSVN